MSMLKKTGACPSAALRVLTLLALAAMVPACSYSNSGKTYPTGGPVGGPGTVTLLSDAFVDPPGPLVTADANWGATTDSGTSAAIVFPGPYFLDFTLGTRSASVALHSTATTVMGFTSKPVTFTLSFQPP